jgi:hypothetical protein
MFAPDLGSLVQGPNIDQPYNGLLLSIELHKRFRILQLWFEATDVSQIPSIQMKVLTDLTTTSKIILIR